MKRRAEKRIGSAGSSDLRLSAWMSNKQVVAMLARPVRIYSINAARDDRFEQAGEREVLEMMLSSLMRQMARTEILRAAHLKLEVELVYEASQGSGLRLRAIINDQKKQ